MAKVDLRLTLITTILLPTPRIVESSKAVSKGLSVSPVQISPISNTYGVTHLEVRKP